MIKRLSLSCSDITIPPPSLLNNLKKGNTYIHTYKKVINSPRLKCTSSSSVFLIQITPYKAEATEHKQNELANTPLECSQIVIINEGVPKGCCVRKKA